MKLTPLHERLQADILDLGSPCPLVLTGGYAGQAHGLVERFSHDRRCNERIEKQPGSHGSAGGSPAARVKSMFLGIFESAVCPV
ncbi:hypothetical protein ACIQUX_01060 [Streptomyces sp. NPDC101133]|uniref:hypothetical protein n=1 Tax=Streptomyces sp. NPDC101133 TaxID=3366111 RepID=UPI0037F1E3EA